MPALFSWRRGKSAVLLAVLVFVAAISMARADATAGSAHTSAPAHAATVSDASSGIPPAMPCADVASLDLAAAVPDAPFEITSATQLAAGSNKLGSWAACDVKGVIAPQIHFELRLPRAAGRPTTSSSAAAACAAT
jgi:feruloyl esterase